MGYVSIINIAHTKQINNKQVIGYLNGANIRKVFNIKTGVIKFLSVIFAVGSGLPVGPEGPMIHMGAIIGLKILKILKNLKFLKYINIDYYYHHY